MQRVRRILKMHFRLLLPLRALILHDEPMTYKDTINHVNDVFNSAQ